MVNSSSVSEISTSSLTSVSEYVRITFFEACKTNSVTQVVEFLTFHQELINTTDAMGNTGLHYACAKRNLATIKKLLMSKANIEVKNKAGETPSGLLIDAYFELLSEEFCDESSRVERDNNLLDERPLLEEVFTLLLKENPDLLQLHGAKFNCSLLEIITLYEKVTGIEINLEGLLFGAFDQKAEEDPSKASTSSFFDTAASCVKAYEDFQKDVLTPLRKLGLEKETPFKAVLDTYNQLMRDIKPDFLDLAKNLDAKKKKRLDRLFSSGSHQPKSRKKTGARKTSDVGQAALSLSPQCHLFDQIAKRKFTEIDVEYVKDEESEGQHRILNLQAKNKKAYEFAIKYFKESSIFIFENESEDRLNFSVSLNETHICTNSKKKKFVDRYNIKYNQWLYEPAAAAATTTTTTTTSTATGSSDLGVGPKLVPSRVKREISSRTEKAKTQEVLENLQQKQQQRRDRKNKDKGSITYGSSSREPKAAETDRSEEIPAEKDKQLERQIESPFDLEHAVPDLRFSDKPFTKKPLESNAKSQVSSRKLKKKERKEEQLECTPLMLQRVQSALASFQDFSNLAKDVFVKKSYRLDDSSTKKMTVLALQEFLSQGCEALIPTTSNQALCELEIEEQNFRKLLTKYFIAADSILEIGGLCRHHFLEISEYATLEFARFLYEAKVDERLKGSTSSRNYLQSSIKVKGCKIFNHPRLTFSPIEYLNKILEQVAVIEELMETSKHKDSLADFMLQEHVRIAALKKTYSNIAHLLTILLKDPDLAKMTVFNSAEVISIRMIGTINAHEIFEFPKEGGILEQVTPEVIYACSRGNPLFIPFFKTTISMVIYGLSKNL